MNSADWEGLTFCCSQNIGIPSFLSGESKKLKLVVATSLKETSQ